MILARRNNFCELTAFVWTITGEIWNNYLVQNVNFLIGLPLAILLFELGLATIVEPLVSIRLAYAVATQYSLHILLLGNPGSHSRSNKRHWSTERENLLTRLVNGWGDIKSQTGDSFHGGPQDFFRAKDKTGPIQENPSYLSFMSFGVHIGQRSTWNNPGKSVQKLQSVALCVAQTISQFSRS